MMKNTQKKELKRMSNTLKPIFQIGKEGVSEQLIKALDEAFNTHELIKISVLSNNKDDVDLIANKIVDRIDAHLIQTIGRKIVIYRKFKEEK